MKYLTIWPNLYSSIFFSGDNELALPNAWGNKTLKVPLFYPSPVPLFYPPPAPLERGKPDVASLLNDGKPEDVSLLNDGKPEDASLLNDGKPDVASLFVEWGMRGGFSRTKQSRIHTSIQQRQ
ncbi:hypothetical protein [Okeania sp. KiyG1]|uniref:hypothetical protein n=1 Tax=Okeania sp. KiyG1 TaxID=2720165 RepID=UPI001921DFE6|nr:hypothetical protein [Okeania sp. KiyG1]